MTVLKVFKSNGFWMFILLWLLVDLLIVFMMPAVRSNWTVWIVELFALFFYLLSQFISVRDEEAFFWKFILKNKKV